MNAPRKLPGNLETNRLLERWLRIDRDGTVTVYTGKVEIGQGILTAITQVVADELDVALDRIRLETADTARGPDEGITSGSRSIEESAVALRYACAEVRELLLQRAAIRLGVSLEKVTVADGVVSGGGGSVTYWELTDEQMLKREATAQTAPKPAGDHEYIGARGASAAICRRKSAAFRPIFRTWTCRACSTAASFVRPRMRRGSRRSTMSTVTAMPGVIAVVRDGSFLGVVAAREDEAVRAARRLARLAQWRNDQTLPADVTPGEYLLAQSARVDIISEKSDAAAQQRGGKVLAATYYAALHRACVDGAVVRGRAIGRRSLPCVDAQPGHPSVAPRHGEGAGCGSGRSDNRPRRRRRLLWSQRRRRCCARCGIARTRGAGAAGAGAVDARGRICVGALWLGHAGQDRCRARCARQYRRLADGRLELSAQHASSGQGRREPRGGVASCAGEASPRHR